MHDFDAVATMVIASTEGRRKMRHCRLLSLLEEDKEEDEGN